MRCEWFGEKGDAPRGQRSLADLLVRIPGHIDNRHGDACSFQILSQLNARSVRQVDIEDDASRLLDVGVIFECLRG